MQKAVIWCAVSTQAQTAEDKISLPEQERAAREWCVQNGYDVVSVLRVEGYSRRESDIVTALDEFREQGVTAYDELRKMWMEKSFDVLVAYTHSRFGRSSTLHSYVIENVIRSGAKIFLIQGGWISDIDFRFSIAMGGVMATTEVDRLIKIRHLAMNELVKRGLPTSSGHVASHKVIRNEYGKALRMEVDESKRRLWNDVAVLLLEGVGWKKIEEQLYIRFGHSDGSGNPYPSLSMYKLIHHPAFWGNNARFFRSVKYGKKTDMWIFDPDEPAPDGVLIYYNTHEPVYKAELAEKVKAELRRRRKSVRGTNRPHRSKRFTGLLICAACGYYLNYRGNKQYPGYKCASRYWQRTACEQNRGIPEWKVQQWLEARLEEMMKNGSPTLFIADTSSEVEFISRRVNDLKAEIDDTDDKIRRMLRKQATIENEIIAGMMDEEIRKMADQMTIMMENLVSLERQKPSSEVLKSQLRAFSEIKEMSLDAFWQLPSVQMNQLLHRLFGNRRLAVEDAEIVGVVEAPRR